MRFPKEMVDSPRWMIRHRKGLENETKQPESVHVTRPDEYIGDWHRTRWAQPCQWSTYDAANDYRLTHPSVDYMCFVLRDVDPQEKTRFICFDVDGCVDDSGTVDPDVDMFAREIGSYTEFSLSGRGLHIFSSYEGPPLKKCRRLIGHCDVDVITTGQVVVTGDVYDGLSGWAKVDCDTIRGRFDMRVKTQGDGGRSTSDCWGSEFHDIPDDRRYLEDDMSVWVPCVQGSHGDNTYFSAACHLARHGVTGEAARRLLSMVDCRPPFSDEETIHKIECAFITTTSEGEFGAYHHGRLTGAAQFEAVEPEAIETPDGVTEEEAEFLQETGFEGLELSRHLSVFSSKNSPDFILPDIMFERGALMIGGQNKTFKTTIGLDLLVSVATGEHFLGEIEVACGRKSVAIFSHETITYHMSQYLETIMKTKGVKPKHFRKSFTVNSTVPAFTMGGDGAMKRNKKFESYLDQKRPDIVFFDPLYLMLVGVNQADISVMGQALAHIEKTCAKFGAMPIFCHHARKPEKGGTEFPIMTLNDLSGASGGAFARQWLLLSHTQNYVNGAGRLHMCVGASGGDQQHFIVNVETYDKDRNNVWYATAHKQNVDHEIIHRLQIDGPTTIRQLANRLKTTEYVVEQACHRMEGDKVDLHNKTKVSLVSQKSGEVDL